MDIKPLVIGDMVAKLPLIQGGMGVGVSLARLAGTVAAEGGIGIISAAQIGFREPDYDKNPLEANLRAIGTELKKAREIACGGPIGFNIMVATNQYEAHVKEACKQGADIIISGAGVAIDLPKIAAGFRTKLAPIVSSVKSASVLCRMWDRKYNVAPDLVVIEGPKAGGHLGFKLEQLAEYTIESYDLEIKKIIAEIKLFADKYKKHIPVVVAGGIYSKNDIKRVLSLGADGVQVATRFVTTEECDASDAFKQAYINAEKEDIIIVKSPVGMPGRAIKNKFLERVGMGEPIRTNHCHKCIKMCKPAEIPYCISDALVNSVKGDIENGLVFCGASAYRATKIETVKDVIHDLFY